MVSNTKADIQKPGIKAVVISTESGCPLVTLKIDLQLDEHVLVPFLSAIRSFSSSVLGINPEMYFKSGDNDLYCFHKKFGTVELMIFALMNSSVEKINIRDESEMALDAFIEFYGIECIEQWKGDVIEFKAFEKMLQEQVEEYYTKIPEANSDGAKDKGKGFFARLFSRMKAKKRD